MGRARPLRPPPPRAGGSRTAGAREHRSAPGEPRPRRRGWGALATRSGPSSRFGRSSTGRRYPVDPGRALICDAGLGDSGEAPPRGGAPYHVHSRTLADRLGYRRCLLAHQSDISRDDMSGQPSGAGALPARRLIAERAYFELRDRIVTLRLHPGTALVEDELMSEIGIGRTPLREAIKRLALENLVERSEERRVGKECRSRWSPYH